MCYIFPAWIRHPSRFGILLFQFGVHDAGSLEQSVEGSAGVVRHELAIPRNNMEHQSPCIDRLSRSTSGCRRGDVAFHGFLSARELDVAVLLGDFEAGQPQCKFPAGKTCLKPCDWLLMCHSHSSADQQSNVQLLETHDLVGTVTWLG